MLEFLKKKITGHPKFYLQMFMFILEKMVPRVELESISTACANVSTLPVTVQKLASSVGAFDSCLPDLEDTAGLEVGGGEAMPRNARRKKTGGMALMEGTSAVGSLISLEKVRVRGEV